MGTHKKSCIVAREVIAYNMLRMMLEYGYSENVILTAFEEYKTIIVLMIFSLALISSIRMLCSYDSSVVKKNAMI